jgi:hypothetical protein
MELLHLKFGRYGEIFTPGFMFTHAAAIYEELQCMMFSGGAVC